MALEFVNKALEVDGSDLNALSTKSKIFINMGLLDEALGTLDILLAIYPNSIDDLMNKSFVLLKNEEYSEVRKCLEKVLKLDPANEVALKIKEDMLENNDYWVVVFITRRFIIFFYFLHIVRIVFSCFKTYSILS